MHSFGFLQNFYAEDHLIEVSDATVTHYVLEKAVEIAMLGMVDECNAIVKVLADHGQFDSGKAGIPFQCVWLYSPCSPPDIGDRNHGSVWIPSEADVERQRLESRKSLINLPAWCDWNNVSDDLLTKMLNTADTSRSKQDTGPWMGVSMHSATVEYAAVLHMACELDRSDVIERLMPVMASRIHCRQQADYLSQIPRVWKDYLLGGWLREQLCLSKEALQEYATHVLDITRQRFERGPRRPTDIYAGLSISQLLDIIDQNTVSTHGYVELFRDSGASVVPVNTVPAVRGRRAHTILQPAATAVQIAAVEERISHTIPNDLKDFFLISNGCSRVGQGKGFFSLKLPPIEMLSFEREDYMEDYWCEVVPQLPRHLDVEWAGIENGGIAWYEHDGQGTNHVWIIGAEDIRRSKDEVQCVYDEANADDKAIIDRHIQYWYGSREAYDAVTDHCYVEVGWGEGARAVYPDFKSYLARVACESRPYLEQSPLKVVEYDSAAK